jgi:hypothetical protein
MPQRSIQRTLALLGATTALSVGFLGGTGPAQADSSASDGRAVSDTKAKARASSSWEVPQHKVYDNDPWPFAGQCFGGSYATYDSTANSLQVVSRANNTSAISACRLQTRLTLHLTIYGYQFQETVVTPIPTACSTTDPTCPANPAAGVPGRGTAWDDFRKSFPAGMTLTGISNYVVERR